MKPQEAFAQAGFYPSSNQAVIPGLLDKVGLCIQRAPIPIHKYQLNHPYPSRQPEAVHREADIQPVITTNVIEGQMPPRRVQHPPSLRLRAQP